MAPVRELRDHTGVQVQMKHPFCTVKSELVRATAGECKIAAEFDTTE
jgi:hypothetical protein